MMTTLAEDFQRLRSAGEALPNDSQCPECGFFDITHPDVRRILIDRDASKRILASAQCKCQDRKIIEKAKTSLRYDQAALPLRTTSYTFENFTPRPGTEEMIKAAGRFLRGEGPRILTLVGNPGAGKSHILEAIGWAALDMGRSVRYDLAATFLNRLRHTYNADSGDDVFDLLAWYQRQSVLLIDDIGLEQATPWVQEQLTALIEGRIQSGGWTATATNWDKSRMTENLGPRLASRLFATNSELGAAEVVINTAGDYRS